MPWRACRPMDERLRFIARLLEGEKMAPLCREFGMFSQKIVGNEKSCPLNGKILPIASYTLGGGTPSCMG